MKKQFKVILIAIFGIFAQAYTQTSVVEQILNKINLDSLKLVVRQLSGDTACTISGQPYTIASRNKSQPGNQKAADYILQKFQSYGLTAQFENFSTTGNNVVGTKVGEQFPNKYYVVCAHYDDMPSGTLAPGADDNGSGTAAVIEMARVFSQYNFPYTIKFLAFDEEEQGLIGSAYYATQARNRNDEILGVLNLDMIAYDGNNDNIINVHTKAVANTAEIVADFVGNITAYNIGLVPVVVASQPYSDHDSFYQKNYGATLIIEDDNDFHPKYHTTLDNVTYYNWQYFFKMNKAVAVTLAKWALNFKIILNHTQPFTYTSSVAPVEVTLNVSSGLSIGTGNLAPRCYYRTITGSVTGQWNYVNSNSVNGLNHNFLIPGQSLGTVVEYYFAVQDQNNQLVQTMPAGGSGTNPPGSTPPPAFYSYAVANVQVVFSDDASNISHWLSQSLWGVTSSAFVSPPSSFTDSPSGLYPNSTTNTFWLKDTISLDSALKARLTFQLKFELEDKYDYVQLQISTNIGQSWSPLAGKYTKLGSGSFQPAGEPLYNGTQSAWVGEDIDLSAYINKKVMFRFYFRSDGSQVKDGFYFDDFKVLVFKAGTSGSVTSAFSTIQGWNLVSVPINKTDMTKSGLFPSSSSNAYGYTNSYIVIDTLKNGIGYWLKFNEAANHQLQGSDVTTLNIPVTNGWNLIGGINSSVPVGSVSTNPTGIISGYFYEYSGAYNQATTLDKGKGYWIKVNQDGIININKTLVKPDEIISFERYKNIINISDNNSNQQNLYLTNNTYNKILTELPPMPPAGSFDVRYSDNSFVADFSKENILLLNSAVFPVTIKLNTEDNINLKILDDKQNVIGNLTNNNSIKLLEKTGSIRIVPNTIPEDFTVLQNYPNPFNPTTSIKYRIPSDGNVKISVFNSIGEIIQVISRDNQKAGTYSFDFDGKNLSSGIYIFNFSFENQSKIIKATLIK